MKDIIKSGVDYKNLLIALGFSPKENTVGVYSKKYKHHDSYTIDVDFEKSIINYGSLIVSENKTTQNFSQPENLVVLECVDRLLEKGYNPQNIVLEKTWSAGHGTSGRLDICVQRDDGSEYLLIECKTYGKEFDKEFTRMGKDGGQLFTYFKFSNKADVIMLYASELRNKNIVYRNEIVKIEEDYRSGDVKDFYDKWNKLTKDNGVFDSWVKPYYFESKALTINELEEIKQEDSSFIFNRFLEILRHNVVSDKPNAFNKIFTLFLCKIYDEKVNEGTDNELGFQWIEGVDDDTSFQLRLTDLYKEGMWEFLEKRVTDFSEDEFEQKYKNLDDKLKIDILKDFKKLRLEKNNEFAIKEVYDEKSFKENAKVVKQVVELLQKYKIRYAKKQQYLSDFFELLLTTGLKQESGQFFTPVPIAQFIIKSLPIDNIVETKLKEGKRDELLPYIIDYAAGSGHFITESMHEIQRLLNKFDLSKVRGDAKKFVETARISHFDWALRYIYGIEKDYRLVKVGKVGCYLHGDGLANVIHSDGLANFKHPDYKGKLKEIDKDFKRENKQFDIVVSNPPYSVSAFKNAAREYYKDDDFDLYGRLTDNSSEIECLFIERTKQLLKDGGVAGIILPSSILSNAGIYTKSREIILQYFDIIAITELGSNTFMATGTNTVVLFLRRKNNYDSINLRKSVDSFFATLLDVTLNGVENPVSQYVNNVWEGISFEDYITLLQKTPSKTIEDSELYQEYRKKIKAKTDKEFWDTLLEREREKLYYFILTYPQKIVLVKSGEKDAEKRFLGYEFSNRRGSEGIHPVQRGKAIDECTKLFDTKLFDNPEKASTYVYKAFAGDTDFVIDESMKENVSRVSLVDMLTFDRADFEKTISTTVKKKVKIENKWNDVRLGDLCTLYQPKTITSQEIKDKGKYKVFGANGVIGFYDTYNHENSEVVVTCRGATSGTVNYTESKSWITGNAMVVTPKTTELDKLFLYYLLSFSDLSETITGTAQPQITRTTLEPYKIPLPPKDIQEKIIAEIKSLEDVENKANKDIVDCNSKIEKLFLDSYQNAKKQFRLSDSDKFSVSIGKRVVAYELITNEGIPVYSANVFEPFGNIDKVLIDDFSIPSILWGIDGDWMVNCISENRPFYPTDHCGILRVLNNEIIPKYVAYALNLEGKVLRFSRQFRASIDRVSGITIKVPSFEKQQKVIAEIEALEKQIAEAQKIIDNGATLKNEVLKKYL